MGAHRDDTGRVSGDAAVGPSARAGGGTTRKNDAVRDRFHYIADDLDAWPASIDWGAVVGLIREYTVLGHGDASADGLKPFATGDIAAWAEGEPEIC